MSGQESRFSITAAAAGANHRSTILSVAYPYAVVGEEAVGGAEVILSQIEAALPGLGFDSVVVAHERSRPHGKLYPVGVPAGEITRELRKEVEENVQRGLDRALRENAVALIHMHGLDFHRYTLPRDIPVLVTLHLPPSWYPASIWAELGENVHLLCVSETERQSCPVAIRDRVGVIANGVPLPDPGTLRVRGKYALMLARICPEKNLHTGLDAARMAETPVLLAGEVFPYPDHQRYFANEIEPRLTRRGAHHEQREAERAHALAEARFLGPVTGAAKAKLLARAACLLLPSLAPETSSLVAMEAFAAGVPVIGMRSGAVPEIVEDGRTGFLIDPGLDAADQMAEAIRRVDQIDRGVCRTAAERRFCADRMLREYAAMYRRLGRTQVHAEPSAGAQTRLSPRRDHPPLAAAEITDANALAALEPEWSALWQTDTNATPFQHPAWLMPWWRQFGVDGKLHGLALRNRQDELLGWVPLYIYRQPETGNRQLLLLGAGTTDYLDGIWEPACDLVRLGDAALSFMGRELLPAWDSVALTQLRSVSPLWTAANRAGLNLALSRTEGEPTSVISTEVPLPAKVAANIRRYRRRAEAHGQARVTVAETEAEALASFEELVRLHGRRWEARGESGVLTDPRVLAHHREAIPALLCAGLLRIFKLTLNGQTLGVLYALADGEQRSVRSLYLYLIGFDGEFAALSPGSLLLYAVWEYAREQGFAQIDLLRGGERYKALWGAEATATFAVCARQPNG